MFAGKTAKSFEYRPSSSTGGADAKGTLRKTQSYAHRRRSSSIPKPSPEAPLFRNDPLDRFCSRIPYPKTKGNLYYDILTGEQRWRHGKQSEPKPRGGLSHLLARRMAINSEPTRERVEQRDGVISMSSISGTNPSLSDVTLTRDSACSQFQECSPHSSSASDISLFSTRRLHNASLSSQNTVLEYGSEMTDYMDYLENLEEGEDHPYHPPESLAASETSCDTSLDDLMCVSNEAVRFVPTLPSTFWQERGAKRDERGGQWDVDYTRVASASEVHATDMMDDGGHGRHAMPSSTISTATTTRQAMFYKLGRFRRRPQIPVSETSDSEGEEGDLTDGIDMESVDKTTERKRSFTNVIFDLFGQKSSSLTTDPPTARSDVSVTDDASICVMKSENSSLASSRNFKPHFEHYDWFLRDSSKKSNVLGTTVSEKQSQGNAVCRPRAGWLRTALGFSCKALLVVSVAALGHFLRDHQEKEDRDILEHQEEEEDISNLDLEAHHLSFSDYALASPVGPTTYSYPISLLDSLSDSDA